ncbi:MAG: trk system potassium uptake protein TrkH, partial [Pseudohongiellaceae bacterium]
GLLFWRAMTHWVGGMGIVAMSVAILPALGAGGNFLFQAEVPGPESEKLRPRISSTAKLLWGIYLLLTACQFGALRLAGMGNLDAICHTFATVATGGFGTQADSMTSYSPAVQWIVVVFMALAGANFVMLLHIVRRRFARAARNIELRVYVSILLLATVLCAADVYRTTGAPGGFEPLVRDAAFTTVSLMTSTGFVTANYELWPDGLHGLLLLLMVCGACAGSTGGGAKVIRVIVTVKAGFREVRRLLRPRAVFVVKVGARPLSDQLVFKTAGFFALYVMSTLVFTMVLMGLGANGTTALSAVIACLSNIGPGFDAVGPTSNYSEFDSLSKLALMFCMLLGRLEIYSVLVLFMPLAWRR